MTAVAQDLGERRDAVLDVESALLGLLMLPRVGADLVAAARSELSARSFHRPAHAHLFAAICELHAQGIEPAPLLVIEALRRAGLDKFVDQADVVTMTASAPSRGAAGGLIAVIREHAERVQLVAALSDVLTRAKDPTTDIATTIGWAATVLGDVTRTSTRTVAPFPLGEFLAVTDNDDFDWVIPGLLERGDRFILTGDEGRGKSTALRQIGFQAAAGIHPFTLDPIGPVRVLLVDVENGARLVRRRLQDLRDRIDNDGVDTHLHVEIAADIDLLDPRSAVEFESAVDLIAPELLIAGPIYKMASGDPLEEGHARAVTAVLDRLRARHSCAVLLEAHTPHGNEERPYGASLWKRWPEFGVFLAADGRLRHWRGQRDERNWPAALQRGGTWPWTVASGRDDTPAWDGPSRCKEAVLHLLTTNGGNEMSVNAITDRLRALNQSYRKSTVSVAAEALHVEGCLDVRNGPRGSRLFALKGPENDPVF